MAVFQIAYLTLVQWRNKYILLVRCTKAPCALRAPGPMTRLANI